MHGEAVKNQDVAGGDVAAHPLAADGRFGRNLRNMKVLPVVPLNTEAVGTFEDLERPCLYGAIVKWDPHRKALGISAHELVVLVCMDDQALAVRKDQSSDRFWVDQETFTDYHRHYFLKCGVMGK